MLREVPGESRGHGAGRESGARSLCPGLEECQEGRGAAGVEGLPKEACPDSSPVLGPLSQLRAPNSSPLETSSIG